MTKIKNKTATQRLGFASADSYCVKKSKAEKILLVSLAVMALTFTALVICQVGFDPSSFETPKTDSQIQLQSLVESLQ